MLIVFESNDVISQKINFERFIFVSPFIKFQQLGIHNFVILPVASMKHQEKGKSS